VDSAALAEFLRARRAVVQPADVGLAVDSRRRVAGLRREEIALLAGVSADYYVRLEQGRGHQPSDGVLDALARALQLDAELTAHLHRLARPATVGPVRERVSDLTRELLESWPTTPATVTSSRMNVLAANAIAVELSPCYRPGTNMLRSLFLDPDVGTVHVDWATAAAESVANFRARLGPVQDDPEVSRLVGDLSLASQDFRELWARHDVHTTSAGRKAYDHPEIGRLTLYFHAMPVGSGQVLTVLHARPGSPDADKLALLAAIAAGRAAGR
jgi:transcriptional regulator with XRE-family HTH domain